jgi:hypothetical protein
MYAEFSYDIVPGAQSNATVLAEILKKFESKPNGDPRLLCDVLSDTFICEVVNASDFNSLHQRLSMLRTTLGEQFNYAFSLRSSGDVIRIRGSHNEALARQIVTS